MVFLVNNTKEDNRSSCSNDIYLNPKFHPRVYYFHPCLYTDGSSTPLPQFQLDPITNADLEAALTTTKPSARQLQNRYADWQKEYESV